MEDVCPSVVSFGTNQSRAISLKRRPLCVQGDSSWYPLGKSLSGSGSRSVLREELGRLAIRTELSRSHHH